jgi:hypothetical protein
MAGPEVGGVGRAARPHAVMDGPQRVAADGEERDRDAAGDQTAGDLDVCVGDGMTAPARRA